MNKIPHDPKGFDVVTLQPKVDTKSFGALLACKVFNISYLAGIPSSLRKPNSNQIIRANFAKIIYIILRTKRQQPDEYIKFVNEFRRLDKEYQEELTLEQQHR